MLNFNRYQLIAAGVVVAIGLVGTGFLVAKSKSPMGAGSGEIRFFEPGATIDQVDGTAAVRESDDQSPQILCVHIAGKITNPGVYELQPGSRVNDAIEAAGGVAPNADLESINLAEKLTDGQQIYIAPKGEIAPPVRSVIRGGNTRQASSVSAPSAESSGPVKFTTPGEGTVNINTAGSDELQRLPGIGPAMAERIIEYRKQHGRFNSVEELIEVRGIGDKTFERMRPFVSI